MLLPVLAVLGLASPLEKRFFDWFTKSEGVRALHKQHCEGDQVLHMLKGTPMASAPESLKLKFAKGPAGKAVANFMKAEQQNIGAWKIDRIVEAAGPEFDPDAERLRLQAEVATNPIVVFSFVDCPWCLLAKERLRAIESSEAGAWIATAGGVRVIELEDLGRTGKALRAAIALATGRTSMPEIFVGGKCIGGFTDGEPEGDPELCHEGSPGLEALTERGDEELHRLFEAS
jgi:glutaredoxin